MSDADLAAAARAAVLAHPEGVEAGPKAVLTAVQEAHAEFTGVGIMKFKKVLSKVKAEIKDEEEKARIEAAKPKVGSIENCPGRHGLKRFITNHSSYCCDTCRCYLPEGAPMWGCRECDWDVCEGRCHPEGTTLSDLKTMLSSLENRVKILQAEGPSDIKTKMALVEADVHKLEKTLDNASVQDLVKFSILKITEEEARTEKKALISGSEALLTKIESIFTDLRSCQGDASVAAAAA
mmetsp:Transcript_85089/g.214495  ORF Transcript_85089/g.214495 Transcript_85089/m.214495 type:complete len:237 (+) Transcript_85089:72-782(+)